HQHRRLDDPGTEALGGSRCRAHETSLDARGIGVRTASSISPAALKARRNDAGPTNSPRRVTTAAVISTVSPSGPGKRSANAKPTLIDKVPAESIPKPRSGPALCTVGHAARTNIPVASFIASRAPTTTATKVVHAEGTGSRST